MTGPMSRLDTMRDAAVAHAANQITSTLRAQGVDEVTAQAFCENQVTLFVSPNLKVHAELGERRSNGSSDAALVYFARELHLFHSDELGGTPVPFGFHVPPVNAEVQAQAERVAAARVEAEFARQRLRAQDEHTSQVLNAAGAAGARHVAEWQADPRAAF